MSVNPDADCFVGEIRLFGGKFAPVGWAFCNGQKLNISNYQELFSLIGTIYGGDGATTFAVPDLQYRLPIGFGQGKNLANNYPIGATGGSNSVSLVEANIPSHTHGFVAANVTATIAPPTGNLFANAPAPYTEYLVNGTTGVSRVNADAGMTQAVGGGMPHLNIMPTMIVTYIIALGGYYPTFSS